MGVSKGNVELDSTNDLFALFLYLNSPPEESTATAIPPFPLDMDPEFFPVSHGTRDFFSLVSGTAFLDPQEILTPEFVRCAMGEATLGFGMEEEGSSKRCKDGTSKGTNEVLAPAFRLGRTLVTRNDEPLHLRGNIKRPSSKGTLVLFNLIS